MALTQEQKSWVDKYNLKIEWSNEDDAYVASVEELPNCMTHGETREEALSMAKEAIQGHIEALKDEGVEIPEPISLNKYSGDFLVRAYPELHKKLVLYSRKTGKSMNEASIDVIKAGLEAEVRLVSNVPRVSKKSLPMMAKKMARPGSHSTSAKRKTK